MSLKQEHPHNYYFSFQSSTHPQDGYSYPVNHRHLDSLLHKPICFQVMEPPDKRLGWFPQQEIPMFLQLPFKIQVPVQPICAYILPVLSLNIFLCKITVHWKACILKYPHNNIYIYTHIKYLGQYLFDWINFTLSTLQQVPTKTWLSLNQWQESKIFNYSNLWMLSIQVFLISLKVYYNNSSLKFYLFFNNSSWSLR